MNQPNTLNLKKNQIPQTQSQAQTKIEKTKGLSAVCERLERTHGERPGGAGPLPCLYSNNGIENNSQIKFENKNLHEINQLEIVTSLSNLLTPYHKKVAHTLFTNVEKLINESQGINNIGFLTLTFPKIITDAKEASKKFKSFNSNYLSKDKRFRNWIAVKEKHKSGGWHYHLVISLNEDIRTGINFHEIDSGIYTSAPKNLRILWADLRKNLQIYGLGRSELLPVRSNAEAMARYVGKYISKHISQRDQKDKGVRLVAFSGGWIKNNVKFAWHTENAKEWRRKLALFADYYGCNAIYQLTDKLGSGWAYKYAEEIYKIEEIILTDENGCHPNFVPNVIKTIEKSEKRFKESGKITKRYKKKLAVSEEKSIINDILENEWRTHNENKKLPPAPF